MAMTVVCTFGSFTHALPVNFTAARFFGPGPTTQTTTTSDGKTLAQLLAESGVGFCPWDMEVRGNSQWGTIASPTPYVQYGIAIQDAIVAAGRGWGLKYGVGPEGYATRYVNTGDPTLSPASIPSNQQADPGMGSKQWVRDWATWAANRWGSSRGKAGIMSNEWPNLTGPSGGYLPYWYTNYSGFPAEDWGSVNTRYYTSEWNSILPAVPWFHLTHLAGASDVPESAGSGAEVNVFLRRHLTGEGMDVENWAGGTYAWPHGTSYNTMGGIAYHSYGYTAAAWGGNLNGQAARTATQFAADVNSYKAAYETNVDYLRTQVAASMPYAMEEWWPVAREYTAVIDNVSNAREAFGHVFGFAVHARRQADWNCQFINFWGIGPVPYPGTSSVDSWIMTNPAGTQLIRMPSYYAIRDICSHMANTYPNIVTSTTSTGLVVSGKNAAGTHGAAILMNISAASETLSLTGFNSYTNIKLLPTTLATETALTDLGTTLPASIGALETLYVQGTITGAPVATAASLQGRRTKKRLTHATRFDGSDQVESSWP